MDEVPDRVLGQLETARRLGHRAALRCAHRIGVAGQRIHGGMLPGETDRIGKCRRPPGRVTVQHVLMPLHVLEAQPEHARLAQLLDSKLR